MYEPILSNQVWLNLKPETRQKLREIFNIPKSGHVEVFDNKVMTDGTMVEDFQHLTIEKMKEYLKVDSSDFYLLFNECVKRIEEPLPEGVTVYEETVPVDLTNVPVGSTTAPVEEIKEDTRPSLADTITPETLAILKKNDGTRKVTHRKPKVDTTNVTETKAN